ncbi:MAG: hypothetical protein R2854_05035 [Caldilineaceae bacterium]
MVLRARPLGDEIADRGVVVGRLRPGSECEGGIVQQDVRPAVGHDDGDIVQAKSFGAVERKLKAVIGVGDNLADVVDRRVVALS